MCVSVCMRACVCGGSSALLSIVAVLAKQEHSGALCQALPFCHSISVLASVQLQRSMWHLAQ